MSNQHPKIDEKFQAALEAIDQTRLKFDEAIKNGDEVAAADLLDTITALAKELDRLSHQGSDRAPE